MNRILVTLFIISCQQSTSSYCGTYHAEREMAHYSLKIGNLPSRVNHWKINLNEYNHFIIKDDKIITSEKGHEIVFKKD